MSEKGYCLECKKVFEESRYASLCPKCLELEFEEIEHGASSGYLYANMEYLKRKGYIIPSDECEEKETFIPEREDLSRFKNLNDDNLLCHYKYCTFLENICKEGLSLHDKCKKECRDELIELIKKQDLGDEKDYHNVVDNKIEITPKPEGFIFNKDDKVILKSDSKLPEPSPCCEDCMKRNGVKEYCNIYMDKCPYYKVLEVEMPDLDYPTVTFIDPCRPRREPKKELLYSLDDMKELKEIAEERVRGATRKELIDDFLVKLKTLKRRIFKDITINDLIKEYKEMLNK